MGSGAVPHFFAHFEDLWNTWDDIKMDFLFLALPSSCLAWPHLFQIRSTFLQDGGIYPWINPERFIFSTKLIMVIKWGQKLEVILENIVAQNLK